MSIITIGKVVAAVLSVGTFAFLFINDSWRADNLFLVPDLILCVVLLAAALSPSPWVGRTMLFAFALTTGVFMTSVASYAVEGRFGAASLFGAVVAVVFAALLARLRPVGSESIQGRGVP